MCQNPLSVFHRYIYSICLIEIFSESENNTFVCTKQKRKLNSHYIVGKTERQILLLLFSKES